MRARGEVIFVADVNYGPDSSVDGDLILPSVWLRNSDATLNAAVLYGDAAPGTNAMFEAFGPVQINNNALALLEAHAGAGLSHGVWTRQSDGTLTKIAFEGDATGVIVDATLGKPTTNSTPLMNASINNNGEILLFSIISGMTVSDADDHALLLRNASGNLQLVAREGEAVTELGTGVVASALMGSSSEVVSGRAKLNDQGQVLYTATLSGPGIDTSNDRALWLWDANSGRSLVLQSGAGISGLNAGETIAGFSLTGTDMQLNNNGEVLLQVTLAGNTVTSANDQALVYYNATDGANVFLREGDTMSVASGDSRVVSDYLLAGNPGINSSSQVLFAAGFGGSYGLFLTTPAVAPPPPPPSNGNTGCDKEDDHEHSHYEDDDDDDGDDDRSAHDANSAWDDPRMKSMLNEIKDGSHHREACEKEDDDHDEEHESHHDEDEHHGEDSDDSPSAPSKQESSS